MAAKGALVKAEIRSAELAGLTVKYRLPALGDALPLIVLLHGWTGDEDSMWVFADKLPQQAILAAPRGLYPSPFGGYGWYPHEARSWPPLSAFEPAMERIWILLKNELFARADIEQVRLVGFSQGAALAYSLALTQPDRIERVGGLSGFVPDGVKEAAAPGRLNGLPIFVTHGARDDLVPVERARAGVELLQWAGAQVSYCEDDVGHKLSAACFRSLKHFMV